MMPAASAAAAPRSATATLRASSSARLSCSGSQGLATKSIAPSARAWRALFSSFWPDNTMILIVGDRASSSLISLKPSSGRCGLRGQAQVDQRQFRRVLQLAQHAFDLRPRLCYPDVEVPPQDVVERLGDQWIVVHDQQVGFGRGLHRRRCDSRVGPGSVIKYCASWRAHVCFRLCRRLDAGEKSGLQASRPILRAQCCGGAAEAQLAGVNHRHAVADLFHVGQRM